MIGGYAHWENIKLQIVHFFSMNDMVTSQDQL